MDWGIAPFKPKNGPVLRIIIVCRVSSPGPGKQDIRSLDDQSAMIKHWIKEHIRIPCKIKVIAGTGSGECLVRPEYRRLKKYIRSGRFDLVVAEDLSRIARRLNVYGFCELCEDHGTRVIAIRDGVDTATSNWRDSAVFSAAHHERSNRDTSYRIKRSLIGRFQNGGCLNTVLFGYIKPPGARTDADMKKDPTAEPYLRELFDRLDQGASFTEGADYLNESGVKPPPMARGDKWTCRMVSRTIFNPIFKGVRERNRRKSKRLNKTGKYRTVKADPSELLRREVQHLAFFDAAYYDRVIAKVRERNARYRRSEDPQNDPRRGVPRRKVRFPAISARCGVCGRAFILGAHGQREHLFCAGARDYFCWAGVSFDGEIAAKKLTEAVLREIEMLEGFDDALLNEVREKATELDSAARVEVLTIKARLDEVAREIKNFVAYIAKKGEETPSSVHENLRTLEEEQSRLRSRVSQLETNREGELSIPSLEELKVIGRKALTTASLNSPVFARAMHVIVPSVLIYPVRLCNDAGVGMRAKIRVHLARILPDKRVAAALDEALTRELVVDLFEPPKRVRYLADVVRLRDKGKSERAVASSLGITVTAAQRAMQLCRDMRMLGVTDPYITVKSPDECSRLSRHKHKRYGFTPLPGFPAV